MSVLSKPAARLLPLLLSLSSVSVQAQVGGGTDAGSLLQQINPPVPQAPSPTGTGLQVEGQGATSLPAGTSFRVERIVIEGNTLIDAASLRPLVAQAEGATLDLSQLNQAAGRITEYYRSRGYPLARAIIPAQTVRDGVVRIEVIEARYGRVKLDNRSRVGSPLLERTLQPLRSGEHVHQADLDRALLLLGDIPGVAVGAALKPGQDAGTSDLDVTVDSAARTTGHATLDNFGNRYTGHARATGSLSVANPLGMGDLFNASVLTSGKGLAYARAGYESVLNGAGTRAGVDLHAIRYELGDILEPLGAHGRAYARGLWLRHPFIRSRDANVYGQAQYDGKRLQDRVDAGGIRNDRHVDKWSLAVNGDWRDGLLSASVSTWSLAWSAGRLRFDDAAAEAADAASAGTRGSFSKWTASFSRTQSLGSLTSLHLAGGLQWTHQNLDSSEKLSIGGPSSVRAYRPGAVSGDSGHFVTVELRRLFGGFAGGQLQGAVFVDTARVTLNRDPWVAGPNAATLTGAGVGIEWLGPDRWRVKASVASRLGSAPSVVVDSSHVRGWVEASKAF